MLRQFRSPKFKNALLLGLMLVIIPSFVLFYGYSGTGGSAAQAPMVAATIKYGTFDKREISQIEMGRAQQVLAIRQLEQTRKQGLDLDEGTLKNMGSAARNLEEAINIAILERYAAENGLSVSQDELNQEMLKHYPPQSREAAMRIFQQRGITVERVIANVNDGLVFGKVFNSLQSKFRVTHNEAWLAYNLRETKLTLETARFEVSRYVDKVVADEPSLKAFFEGRKAVYQIPEQVVYEYAQVRKDDLKSSLTVTEDDLTSAYRANLSEYKTPRTAKARQIFFERPTPAADAKSPDAEASATAALKARAQEIYQRAAKGEDFAALANQFNEAKDSPAREMDDMTSGTSPADALSTAGGQLGLISEVTARAYFGDDWTSTVFNSAPGRLLAPLETPGGFGIVQVDAVREGKIRPLAEVREGIRRRLLDEKAGPVFEEAGRRLVESKDASPTLDAFATSADLTVKTTEKVDRNAMFIKNIGMVSELVGTLSSLEKSGGYEIVSDASRHLAIRAVEVFPTHEPTLDEVRERVTAEFRETKARELAAADAAKVVAATKDEASFKAASAAAGSTSTRTQAFAAQDASQELGPIEKFSEAAASMTVGAVRMLSIGRPASPMAYVAVYVAAKQEPDRKEFMTALPKLQKDLLDEKRAVAVNEFLRDRRKALKDQIVLAPYYARGE